MLELLSKMDPGELIGLTAIVGGLITGIVAIVMNVGLAHRKAELAAGLKRSMLERGMSAVEIRMVMDAGTESSLEHNKQQAELAAHMKKSMLERGMSAEEIRIVMDAGSYSSVPHGKQPAFQEI